MGDEGKSSEVKGHFHESSGSSSFVDMTGRSSSISMCSLPPSSLQLTGHPFQASSSKVFALTQFSDCSACSTALCNKGFLFLNVCNELLFLPLFILCFFNCNPLFTSFLCFLVSGFETHEKVICEQDQVLELSTSLKPSSCPFLADLSGSTPGLSFGHHQVRLIPNICRHGSGKTD